MDETIQIFADDIKEDRYSRLRLIPWWDQDRLTKARIMVVGAGALGNELIKNLTLLGIGEIIICDMDTIEDSNLTRSVLFRADDVGRRKAEVAAERAMEINPHVRAIPFVGNIIDDMGLGVYRRVDAVLGGLDNREARLTINRACYNVNKPWIDGAIEALSGVARVFVPGQGPCYECTMNEEDWKAYNRRRSCSLLSREELAGGKIPTTPTSSSVIAGVQVQELLKLMHLDRIMPKETLSGAEPYDDDDICVTETEQQFPVLIGRGFHFNGLTHDSYIVNYQEKPDCQSHEIFDSVTETPWSSSTLTFGALLEEARKAMGEGTVIELDRDIAVAARCSCGAEKEMLTPMRRVTRDLAACPACGSEMLITTTHLIMGKESFLDRTLREAGIPPLHIIRARNGLAERFIELTGDLKTSVIGECYEPQNQAHAE